MISISNTGKYQNPTKILVLGWKSAPFRPRREIINIPKEILMVLGGNLGAKVGISPEITYFIKHQGFYERTLIYTNFSDFCNFPATMP